MQGRVYVIEFENVSVLNSNGDQDLFYVAPADDKPCAIVACYLAQLSDVGDAQEEMLRLRIIRGHGTVGSGGTSVTTPTPVNPHDAASAFTARTNDTTIASAGTAVNVHSDAFNVRAGWVYVPVPEMRPVCSQLESSIVVRLMAGPLDDLTMSGTLYVMEI